MRGIRIAEEYIQKLNLDLSGLEILTEAGSGHYIYSPLIAALSGARRVLAIAPDSGWATHAETVKRLEAYKKYIGFKANCIEIVKDRKAAAGGKFDIFLNLGFVRPIDETLLFFASEKAVVAYMCEKWEWREGDVDLDACRRRSIPVVGINENFGEFYVFEACGQLLLKMLFDAGQEVANCKYIVVGDDRFGKLACNSLRANNAACVLLHIAKDISIDDLRTCEAIITADYVRGDEVLAGIVWSPQQIKTINPYLEIIQFAGHIDVGAYIEAGICVHPPTALPPQRMAQTLSYLGPRSVIGLHCLGIKAAEVVYRKITMNKFDLRFSDLIQPIL